MADASTRTRVAVVASVVGVVLFVIALVRLVGGGDDGANGNLLPVVDLTSASGADVSTVTFRDDPMVINFWYSTCAPCATELREFAAVHRNYADEVRFIGVNPLDDAATMQEFAAQRGVSYELFQDRLADFQTAMRLSSFPATLFVTSDGRIVEQTGVLDEPTLTARVEELLLADRR